MLLCPKVGVLFLLLLIYSIRKSPSNLSPIFSVQLIILARRMSHSANPSSYGVSGKCSIRLNVVSFFFTLISDVTNFRRREWATSSRRKVEGHSKILSMRWGSYYQDFWNSQDPTCTFARKKKKIKYQCFVKIFGNEK